MKNAGVIFGIAAIVFAGALAAIIGSRLTEQTVTLLIGAACGAGLTAPAALLAGLYIGAQRAERTTRDRQPAHPQPIVVMTPPPPPQATPPLLPTWGNVHPVAPGMAAPEPRQYTILGEETVIDGTTNVW